MNLRAILGCLVSFAFACAAHAQLLQPVPLVYPGCAVPPTSFNHVWWFDPGPNGHTPAAYAAMTPPIPMPALGQGPTPSTQGSQQHPWNDLSAVAWSDNNAKAGYHYPLLSTVPTYQLVAGHYTFATGAHPGSVQQAGPIQPGDEVLLMGGAYAPVNFSVPGLSIVNPSFITIAAAPGQTPLLPSLVLGDITMLHFDGIKVRNTGGNMVRVFDGGGGLDGGGLGHPLTTHDIVFTNMDISNADVSVADGWPQTWWQTLGNTFSAAGSNDGANTYCVSLTSSHVYVAQEGPILNTTKTLVWNNEVDHITDNFFSRGGSNQTWQANYTHDAVDSGQYLHRDVMQGEAFPLQAGQTSETFANVVITGNLNIDRADPLNRFLAGTTGWDDYSGVGYVIYTGLVVTNNVDITEGTCILFEVGITNTLIANNICVPNGHQTALGAIAVALTGNHDVRICNNLAPIISYVSNQPNVTADNNIATEYAYWRQNADGSFQANPVYYTTPGWYGPTGGGARTPQSATATNQIVSLANFLALFQQAPTIAVPPSFNLALVPGSTTNGSQTCAPQTGYAGPAHYSNDRLRAVH